MYVRTITLAVSLLGLAACGDVTVEEPKGEQAEQDGEQLETVDQGGASETPATEPAYQNDTAPAAGVEVAVDVDVTVVVGDAELEAVRYSPRLRAWQDAVDHAPKGYRLATRAELVDMIDRGEIADLDAGGAVWTATERDDRTAQLVELESGRSAPADKGMRLSAVYVLETATAATAPTSYPVFPNSVDGQTVGNTGLGIDVAGGRLFHARYDWSRSSSIAIRSRTNEDLGTVDLTAELDHVQGVAYDSRDGTLYAWGMPRGVEARPWSTDYVIVHVDLDGRRIGEPWHTPAVDGYPGMIVVDEDRNLIWLKANSRKVAHAYDLETKALVETVDFGIAGEGIAFDAEAREFWLADRDGVYRCDAAGVVLERFPNPTFDGSSEGMAFDRGVVWLNADEGLHGDHADGNRVYRIQPEGRS